MRFQATDGKASDAGATSNRQALTDLSPAGHLLLPIAIFVIALLTLDFSHRSHFIMTLWLPNAVILVALLRHGPSLRNYGSILAGGACAIALAHLATGDGAALSASLGVINIVEVALSLAILSVFRIDAFNLTSFKNLFIFMVIAGGIAPVGSDAIGAIAIAAARGVPWPTLWFHSYSAHALGMIIVAPALISVASTEWRAPRVERRLGEAIAILALVVAVAICAAYFRSVVFIVVPAVLLATLRFGLIGAAVAMLVIAIIASDFIVNGIGQPLISRTEVSDRILALQILLAFTSLWSLPIAALLTERNRLLDGLSFANSQLRVESEKKSNMVTGLHRHLSTVEEKERLRLSRELHDQAGQGLIAAILELSEIDPLVAGTARQRLQLVRKRMEEMGKTLDRIAWELRPPSIDELGLYKALSSYIEDWSEQCGTEVDFQCDDRNLDEVPNEIGATIYRVVQEALTNVVKHAQRPSSVSVIVRRVSTMLQVIIEDNGCGFDVAAIAGAAGRHRGLGLDGMRERLLLIGGTLEIESSASTGTTIFARVPMQGQRSAA